MESVKVSYGFFKKNLSLQADPEELQINVAAKP